MMRDDPDGHLIDLLALWWKVESQYNPVAGYPQECPSTAGYRASRQYDDANSAQETDARGKLAASVGHAVQAIEEPYRSCLYMLARNRATGVSVWRSPRVPVDATERARMVARALDMLGVLI